MFYMVNPSGLPKKKLNKKNKKSRRRNPELLIVNPYSMDEGKEKKRAKMAKRKAKKRKSRSKGRRRRKNPLSKRRRNPGFAEIKDEFLGHDLGNVKTAALMAVGGGLALAVGTAAFGSRLGTGNVGKGAVAILSGVAGGVIAKMAGNALPGAVGDFLSAAAVPGAMGAMVLGIWSVAQPVVEPWADTLNAKLGFAGLGSWSKEFDGLGQAYYDEFTAGVSPGMDGYFGQPVVAATDLMDPEDNPFLSGYEPLGDIYNSQRLGSFEAERGLGGFVPETANPRDQQVADEMKHAAGDYGSYGGYESMDGTLFEPFIED
jgi:hypothetical protein